MKNNYKLDNKDTLYPSTLYIYTCISLSKSRELAGHVFGTKIYIESHILSIVTKLEAPPGMLNNLVKWPYPLNSFMTEAVIILRSKSMDWFLYVNGLRNERVKYHRKQIGWQNPSIKQ